MTATIDRADPAALALMPGDEFRELVNEHVRTRRPDPALTAALRSPQACHRWLETLLVMQKSIEGQLGMNAAEMRAKHNRALLKGAPERERWLAAEAENEQWKAGALLFKSGLDQRIIEARSAVRAIEGSGDRERLERDRDRAIAKAVTLEQAIARHRERAGEPEADEELWSLVEEA